MPWKEIHKNRLLKKITKIQDECWIVRQKSGQYGSLWNGKKSISAHRASFEIFKYKIPKNMCILHSCDNGKCINPNHLSIGSMKDNTQDMIKKGRGIFQKNGGGESHPNHKLKYTDIKKIKALFSQGMNQSKIALLFNVNQCSISRIINNKRWNKYVPVVSS